MLTNADLDRLDRELRYGTSANYTDDDIDELVRLARIGLERSGHPLWDYIEENFHDYLEDWENDPAMREWQPE